jgi:hypothetical protein
VAGPESAQVVSRLCDGLEDAEFSIKGQIVADIELVEGPLRKSDGSTSIVIEALTVGE